MITTLLAFLFALGLLIFVHELGHYLVAKWCGVKVLRFSIGFGKPFVKFVVGPDRTEWSIAPIPLGGYVKMLDEREDPASPVPAAELHRAFNRQSLAKRAAIVIAGPLANFLLAIALYAALGMYGTEEPAARLAAPAAGTPAAAAGIQAGDRVIAIDGRDIRSFTELRLRLIDAIVERRAASLTVERSGSPVSLPLDASGLSAGEIEKDFVRTLGLDLAGGSVVVGSVLPDGSAARAGLLAGDEVLAVDGRPVSRASELISVLREGAGRDIALDTRRGVVEQRIVVVPQAQVSDRPEDQGKTVGRIGAALQSKVEMVRIEHGLLSALAHGAKQTWDMSWFSLRMLGKMLTGDLSWRNLSGPVAIADFAGQSAKIGALAYIAFLALISVSLGVLNLLPVPVLDGGHLVYYGLEAIKGRPLSDRFMQLSQRVGLAAIVGLMVVALFNDLSRLLGG
ncbi:MAG: RIP metalloprotease RseP [Burkholderiales bacterium]|jgi:regulator of sigma E protease|nr:RIP metalloprotease RseP [Burkholderiales bacterium]